MYVCMYVCMYVPRNSVSYTPVPQGHVSTTSILGSLMPESHERILRRIIRRFGSFPTTTYSYSIPNDVNVHITYEERSGRVLKGQVS